MSSKTASSDVEKAKYLGKVVSIIYILVETQVDIAFANSMVSWFVKNLSLKHFNAIGQRFCYLAEINERGITFGW